MRRVFAVVLGVLAVGTVGCRRQAAVPVTPPAPVSVEPPRVARVAVVDLQQAARAHPRWRELNAIIERIQRTEVELMVAPPPPPLPETDLHKALDEEAVRLRSAFQQEVDLMRAESTRQVEVYANDLRKEFQAKMETARTEMVAAATKEVEA